MKRIALAAGVLCLAAASTAVLACPACDDKKEATQSSAQDIGSLTPAQVQSQLAAGRIRVFDANSVDIFNKHHVRGATRLEYDQVKASDLPTDKSAPIVFYCMNERCGASPVAAKRARELGWTNVYLMPAGIQGWIDSGLEVATAAN